jgi:hypothetical protein
MKVVRLSALTNELQAYDLLSTQLLPLRVPLLSATSFSYILLLLLLLLLILFVSAV